MEYNQDLMRFLLTAGTPCEHSEELKKSTAFNRNDHSKEAKTKAAVKEKDSIENNKAFG